MPQEPAPVSDTPKGPYTVDSAVPAFMGLLSREEPETPEPPTPKSKAPERPPEPDEVEDEPAEDETGQEDVLTEDDTPESDDVDEVDEQPEVDTPVKIKLRRTVDGKIVEQEYTEDELNANLLRHEDYTRKTQHVAEERKAVEAEREAVRAARKQHDDQLAQLADAIKALNPETPNWEQLKDELLPEEFAAKWSQWNAQQKALDKIAKDRKDLLDQHIKDATEQHLQKLRDERVKLTAVVPEWADDTKFEAGKVELATFAKSRGFTDDDISQVTDHRVLLLLRDAMLHHKALQKKPKVAEKIAGSKLVEPGDGRPAKKPNKLAVAKAKLAKSGKVTDAEAAFMELLD